VPAIQDRRYGNRAEPRWHCTEGPASRTVNQRSCQGHRLPPVGHLKTPFQSAHWRSGRNRWTLVMSARRGRCGAIPMHVRTSAHGTAVLKDLRGQQDLGYVSLDSTYITTLQPCQEHDDHKPQHLATPTRPATEPRLSTRAPAQQPSGTGLQRAYSAPVSRPTASTLHPSIEHILSQF
jgi:hypothetical protein